MIINPKEILQSECVKASTGCSHITDKQVQQAGIDIRLHRVFTVHTNIITVTEERKPDFNSIYREVSPDSRGLIRLDPGFAYSVDTMEYVKVPENMSAFVVHRSTFNRIGVLITGSVYDPSFEGNIGVTMYVHNRLEIAVGTRIAQIVFIKTDAASAYEGSYQKQRGHVKSDGEN